MSDEPWENFNRSIRDKFFKTDEELAVVEAEHILRENEEGEDD